MHVNFYSLGIFVGTSLSEGLKYAYSDVNFPKLVTGTYQPVHLGLVKDQKITQKWTQSNEVLIDAFHGHGNGMNLRKIVTIEKMLSYMHKAKKILLEGVSGSGKTTLAVYLCQQWAEGKLLHEYDAVIFIPLLSLLAESGTPITLKTLIQMYLSDSAATTAVTMLNAVKGKGALFILDGWDQLHSVIRNDFTFLNDLLAGLKLSEASVIVMSGIHAANTMHCLVDRRIELLGFDEHQIFEYIENHCASFGPSLSSHSLRQHLQQFPNMKVSVQVPSSLTIFCSIAASTETLPENIVQLIEEFVYQKCTLLQLGDGGKTDRTELMAKAEKFLVPLCEIALDGLCKGKVVFSTEDLESKAVNCLVCCEELGFLSRVSVLRSGPNDPSTHYRFSLKLVQEYLAAQRIQAMASNVRAEYLLNQKLCKESQMCMFLAGISQLEDEGFCDFIIASVRDNKRLLLFYLHQIHSPNVCVQIAQKLDFKFDFSYSYVSQADFEYLAYTIVCAGGDWKLDFRKAIIPPHGLKNFSEYLEKFLANHSQDIPRILYLE